MLSIELTGSRALISGDGVPWLALDKQTRYRPQGYEWSALYRSFCSSKGKTGWDGFRHLIYRVPGKRYATFPRGLLNRVLNVLAEKNSLPVIMEDGETVPYARRLRRLTYKQRTLREAVLIREAGEFTALWRFGASSAVPQIGLAGIDLYDYQIDAVKSALACGGGILDVATNGGKTEIGIAVIQSLLAKYPDANVLWVTHLRPLRQQTRQRLANRLDLPIKSIGELGNARRELRQITVAMVQTLHRPTLEQQKRSKTVKERYRQLRDYLAAVDILVLDEVHHTGSTQWYDSLRAVGAWFRLGLSGTPLRRSDQANLLVEAVCGPVACSISNEFLQRVGVSRQTQIVVVPIDKPVFYDGPWHEIKRHHVYENPELLGKLLKLVKRSLIAKEQVLIIVGTIEHGKRISDLLRGNSSGAITSEFVNGRLPSEKISDAMERFVYKLTPVLISTPVLGEGVSMNDFAKSGEVSDVTDVIMLPDGGKSAIQIIQRIGRGQRQRRGSSKTLTVYDFAVRTHYRLAAHVKRRLAIYQQQQFDVEWEE